MKFSIYSELQWWPGKEPAQVYAEVLEQIENADRLGFDTYSAIEHFFFPKFSASPDPIALFSAAAQRTIADQLPDARARAAVPQPDGAGVADRLRRHPDGRPLRVRRRPRPRLDPLARRRLVRRDGRALRRVAGDPVHRPGVGRRAVLVLGEVLRRPRRADRPAAARKVPRLHGRHIGQDVHPGRAEGLGRGRAAAPAVRGAPRAARPVPLEVRRVRHRAGHRLDPRLLSRRGPRHRDPRRRGGDQGVPGRERVAAGRARKAAGRPADRAPATASTRPGSWRSWPRRPTTR